MSRMTDDAMRAILTGADCDRDEAIDMAREIQERRAADADLIALRDEFRANVRSSGPEWADLAQKFDALVKAYGADP